MPTLLSDHFGDGAIDTAKWDVNTLADFNAGVTVVETGGQLVITPLTSTASSNRGGLLSDNAFDLAARGFAVWKLVQKAGAAANVFTRCGVGIDVDNWLGFEVENTTIRFRKRAGGVDSNTTTTYNSTNHLFLMLVCYEAGPLITWFTSLDGLTWTAQRSAVAPGFSMAAVKGFVDAGTTASVATITPATAIFDDVEIGTMDIVAPFEQIMEFGGYCDLVMDPGFPMNLDPEALVGAPFTIPMNKQYNGARLTTAGVTFIRYRATMTGEIDVFEIFLRSAIEGTSAVFNVYVNAVPIWTGGSRPTIAAGQTTVSKTGIGFAVTRGQLVEVKAETVPAAGIPSPIDTNALVVVS
jgi:hypothetical protein